MSTERDELADDIRSLGITVVSGPPVDLSAPLAQHLRGLGYRKPRTVTSVEELAALPNTAVIRDRARDVAEKRGGLWCQYETSDMTDKQMSKFLPATVLDEGKRR